ncbi:hypothetical protein ACWC10_21295 [Streptomyces sp. NPDC001595]|uniref:hypothetical protein n=1 Tax=Streptomyces sp. NPDC001532 TaxID=3154520 RepID=UPI00333389D0
MLRHSGGHRTRSPHRGRPDARKLRLFGLAVAVVCAAALPLAMASAGPVGSGRSAGGPEQAVPGEARDAAGNAAPDTVAGHDSAAGNDKAPLTERAAEPGARRSPFLLGLGVSTAARCGPELTSPDGIEAQTCVLAQAEDTWGRTYYRNATGHALDAVLTLMAPGGRTVQIRCAVDAGDEPASCETPREAGRGPAAEYTAVAEFAEPGGQGPLLLRVGSNSAAVTGG